MSQQIGAATLEFDVTAYGYMIRYRRVILIELIQGPFSSWQSLLVTKVHENIMKKFMFNRSLLEKLS